MLLHWILIGLATLGMVRIMPSFIVAWRRRSKPQPEHLHLRCDGPAGHLKRFDLEQASAFMDEHDIHFRRNALASRPRFPRRLCQVCNPQSD